MQALGLLAEVEGRRFSRRVPELLPLVLALLRKHAAAAALEDALGGADDGGADGDGEGMPMARGWQQAYCGLMLLEKMVHQVRPGYHGIRLP